MMYKYCSEIYTAHFLYAEMLILLDYVVKSNLGMFLTGFESFTQSRDLICRPFVIETPAAPEGSRNNNDDFHIMLLWDIERSVCIAVGVILPLLYSGAV